MNLLHPVYHGHAYQPGSRIDLDELLPANLKSVDFDELLNLLSEPPRYIERLAPVGTQIGHKTVRGKNWTELNIKGYRVIGRMFTQITDYVHQSIRDNFSERGMVPYLSLDIDPDTLHRITEFDYESGENTYSKLIELYESGVLAPSATVPFHVLLPMLESEYDVRMMIRIGLFFYWDILRKYHEFLEDEHHETQFVVPFWLPESGFNRRVLAILFEEFMKKVKEDGLSDPQIVILLDSYQVRDRDNDILMKSWNILRINDSYEYVSVLFRDRKFSEWVTFSNPSVKKLIDRTIAKSDADLNAMNVDYCWSHFEDIESLAYTHKAALNFEQKISKLIELEYLPVSPDFFVRRKMNGRFGRSLWEPQEIGVHENTAWRDWHEDGLSFGRWAGFLDSNAEEKQVDENRPFTRQTPKGPVKEKGFQCWKIAFNKARSICKEAVVGDAANYEGGILEILASIVPSKKKSIIRRNVDNFLVNYALVYWKYHFLHHGYEEADITIDYVVESALCEGCKDSLDDEQIAVATLAARAYYFVMDAHKSCGTFWENMDQRTTYQSVVMLTLSMTSLMYAYHWRGEKPKARAIYKIMKDELFDFRDAFKRYKLEQYGVKERHWQSAIKSHIKQCRMNLVERAARRIAAIHLRPLGYTRDLTEKDENLSTNTGHIWSAEVENTNFKWENPYYCGMEEV